VTPREQQILDAAIDVLASGGGRQLTHRAVDATAGLPVGSTSNRFRTRDALLTGVLGRILERETAVWAGLADGDLPAGDLDAFCAAMGRTVEVLTTADTTVTRARLAVFVEASHRPDLRAEIANGRARIAVWALPALVKAGSTDPTAHLDCLLALIDGLLTSRLTVPSGHVDPTLAIRGLLGGLIGAAAPGSL
jgi:DNA-binding transcriptional regulator YbjK